MNSENKTCQNCKKDFIIESEDFNFYEKIKVPPPTFCPECRLVRRLNWRNESSFYRGKCNLCKKDIISSVFTKNKFSVFCNRCWWGDGWDETKYGKNYDFSRPCFEQFRELMENVPFLNLWSYSSSNAEYSNYVGYSKNIYLSSAVYSENVSYSHLSEKSKDCVDCHFVLNSELCYENFNTNKSFKSIFLNDCHECVDSYFLFDCRNCQNCFMCSNLRNKNFCIRNKQYSREEYFNIIKSYNITSYKSLSKIKKEFENLIQNSIHRFAYIINSVNVSGDVIVNSKNAHHCFMVEGENAKYCWRATDGVKDIYDVSGCIKNELVYEGSVVGNNSYLTKFYNLGKNNKNSSLLYCCVDSSDLFACVGLKHKQYCILNKQYTKEEYEALVPKIIEHMNDMPYIDSKGRVYKYGEFFPPELSPFCYNETIAQEYFPLTKEEALKQGYRWKDREERNYEIDLYTKDIPDKIEEVNDEIINKIIECEHKGECNEQCTEAFKIIESELQFYRRMNLPLPHLCPNCRHYQRLQQRNPLKLWHRKCMKEGCPNEFETSYAPERPEIVYCERCYQQEVY